MPSSEITVIFFDVGDTLISVRGSVADVYLRYARAYGVSDTPDLKRAVQAAFLEAFAKAPPPLFSVAQPENLKQCERLWWFDIVHAVFYRVGMFERFDDYFEEVFEAFERAEHWEVDACVPSVLRELRGAGYELGIISNFDTRLFRILEVLGLRAFFDTVTISSLAQAVKPSGKIFQSALDEHAIDPGEAVHVGDSVREDWQGATDAGLRSVLLDPQGQHGDQRDLLRISSLSELPSLLEELQHIG